jgi:hypothetical protein
VGGAALLHGDDSGMSIVTSTVETLVAIALGVLVGRALSRFVPDRPPSPAAPARPVEGIAEETG